MSYAKDTNVSIEKSEAEIKTILRKFGADSIVTQDERSRAAIGFELRGYRILFRIQMPSQTEPEFTRSHGGRRQRSKDAAYRAWEQACRERWRGLYLCIKAKLVAIESGIETFEQAFLPYVMLPNGQTVAEKAIPEIETVYARHEVPSLLLGYKP